MMPNPLPVMSTTPCKAARGQSLVEYGLFLGLVVVVAAGGLQVLGGAVGSEIPEMRDTVTNAAQNTSQAIAHVSEDDIKVEDYNQGVFINAGAVATGTGGATGDDGGGNYGCEFYGTCD
jgi:Flp pilus assembly pilin Flp